MARKLHIINDFSGGINNKVDKRDIEDNELSSASNIIIDTKGSLRSAGSVAVHGDSGNNTFGSSGVGTTNPKDLFSFSSDYRVSDDSNTPTNYIVSSNFGNSEDLKSSIRVYGDTNNAVTEIPTGWANSETRMGYYFIDGALRIYDLYNYQTPKWFGYIDRHLLNPGTANMLENGGDVIHLEHHNFQGFGMFDQEVYQPSVRLQKTDWNSGDSTTDSLISSTESDINTFLARRVGNPNFYASTREGILGLKYTESDDTAEGTVGWTGGKEYTFYTTFVYDGDQESLPTRMGSGAKTFDFSGEKNLTFNFVFYLLWMPIGTGIIDGAIDGDYSFALWASSNSLKIQEGDYLRNHLSSDVEIVQIGKIDDMTSTAPTINIKRGKFGTTPVSNVITLYYKLNFNPRISAVRLYVAKAETPNILDYVGESLTTSATDGNSVNIMLLSDIVANDEPSGADYLSNTGIDLGEWDENNYKFSKTHSLMSKYRAATVSSGVVYAGNIQETLTDGNTRDRKDRILRSMPFKYDIFPNTDIIEGSSDDGDEIVKLDQYGKHIFMFKKNSTYIINTNIEGETGEFVESVFKNSGTASFMSSIVTEAGVVWANKNGCYLWDGVELKDLTAKLKKTEASGYYSSGIIYNPYWSEFVNQIDNQIVVGYFPQEKQVFVKCGWKSGTGENDCFVYNIPTESWSFFEGLIPSGSQKISQFIVDYNGDLVYLNLENYKLYKWDAAASSHVLKIFFKDIDFGNPAVLKKVYSVTVTHKSNNNSNDAIKYRLNGSDGALTNLGNIVSTDSGATYDITKADLSNVSCQSIQIAVETASGRSIVINDIAIDYREIHKRVS